MASSVLASLLLLLVAFLLRPKIRISKEISVDSAAGDGGSPRYLVKIVNCGMRSCVDLDVFVGLETRERLRGNTDLIKFDVMSPTLRTTTIAPRGPWFMRIKDREKRYARQIPLPSEIGRRRTDDRNQNLVIRVFARDSLFNFGRQIERRYESRSTLREGRFHGGCSMCISASSASSASSGDRMIALPDGPGVPAARSSEDRPA